MSLKMSKLEKMRIKHSYMVGKLMGRMAIVMGWGEKKARECFMIGILHDTGREWNNNNHGKEASKVLKRTGFKYAYEIEKHEHYIKKRTKELELLYYCDMAVDGYGKIVSVKERMKDLMKRHKGEKEFLEELVREEKEALRLEKKYEKYMNKVKEW